LAQEALTMAITCPACGYAGNPDQAEKCICGEPLSSADDIWTKALLDTDAQKEKPGSDLPGSPSPPPPGPGGLLSTMIMGERDEAEKNRLAGRLTKVERYDERSPLGVFKTLSLILIWLAILVPYSILFVVTGIMSFIFMVLRFSTLADLFNPVNWTSGILRVWEILVLRRIRGTDTTPVYRGMVEDQHGQPCPFVLLGPLDLGNLVEGHDVEFSGRRCGGTFRVKKGYDLTSRSEITSAYRNPWKVIFFIMMTIYLVAGVWLIFNAQKLKAYTPS